MHKPEILAIFVLTYLGIAAGRVPGLKLDRTGIAILGAIAVMIFAGLPTASVIGFVNWPTLLLLFAFFVMSAQLRLSGFFDAVAAAIGRGNMSPARFLLYLMLASAGLSAILNHDIVCFVFAPVVAESLIRRRTNPVPFLIALAIASNIGAAATYVGNPQDMMIAQVAGLRFGSYIAWCLVPVVFSFGCAYVIIWALSRNRLALPEGPAAGPAGAPQPLNRAHALKGLVLLSVVILLFFTPLPKEIVALVAAGIHLASPKFRTADLLRLVDWPVLLLFMGLFAVTGAFQEAGCAASLAKWLEGSGLNLNAPLNLVWVTAVLSNLTNNSAAVMLLLKVVNLSNPVTAYTLALANSLGGSLIIVGSVANIIVVQQARENGIVISFREFARIGVPATAVALAGLAIWVALMARF